jgi:hypothetical protein
MTVPGSKSVVYCFRAQYTDSLEGKSRQLNGNIERVYAQDLLTFGIRLLMSRGEVYGQTNANANALYV